METTVLDFRTMTKKDLANMSSEDYAAHFNGPDGDAFREQVDFLEGSKPVQPAVQPAVVEALAAAPAQAAPASEEVKWYEYQPKDLRTGKPIGGLQKFSYKNDAELIEKLKTAHAHATSHIFQLRQDRALDDIGSLPDGPSKDVPLTVAQPRSLTVEETVQVTRLQAEGKTLEAERIKLAATLGIDPAELVSRINRTQEDALRTAINTTIREWKRQTPDFFPCESNNKALIALIGKKGWSPTDPKSWSEAYNYLHAKDALVTKDSPEAVAMQAIEPAPEVQPVVQPAVPPAVQPAAVSQPAVPISTGLNRRNASDSRPVEVHAAASSGFAHLDLTTINTMSSDQYGKLIKKFGPAFSDFVDSLEQKAAEKRRVARR